MTSTNVETKDVARASPASVGGIQLELLTSKHAAELCGIGERTLWRYSRSGICPSPLKLGNGPRAMVRFVAAELRAWVAAGCPRCDRKGGGPR